MRVRVRARRSSVCARAPRCVDVPCPRRRPQTLADRTARLQTREDDLRDKFDHYGKLLDVFIPRDPSTQKVRGFGFVTFVDRRDAEDAVDALDGFAIA